MNKKPEANTETKAIGCVILIVIIGFFWLLAKCVGNSDISSTPKVDISAKAIDTSSISMLPVRKPHVKYQIILKDYDSYGYINTMMVYTKNMDSVASLNDYLLSKYKNSQAVTFQIYYFDNKKIAKNYRSILNDENITDDEVEKMCHHIIGKYEYDQYTNETNGLKIGRDPENN